MSKKLYIKRSTQNPHDMEIDDVAKRNDILMRDSTKYMCIVTSAIEIDEAYQSDIAPVLSSTRGT